MAPFQWGLSGVYSILSVYPRLQTGSGCIPIADTWADASYLPFTRHASPCVSNQVVSVPASAGLEVSVPHSPLLADGVEQDMNISHSPLGDTLSL